MQPELASHILSRAGHRQPDRAHINTPGTVLLATLMKCKLGLCECHTPHTATSQSTCSMSPQPASLATRSSKGTEQQQAGRAGQSLPASPHIKVRERDSIPSLNRDLGLQFGLFQLFSISLTPAFSLPTPNARALLLNTSLRAQPQTPTSHSYLQDTVSIRFPSMEKKVNQC